MANSFGSRGTLEVGKRKFEIHRLSALEKVGLADLVREQYGV